MLSLLLMCLMLSGQLTFVVARPKPVRPRLPTTIPMYEIELAPDHPLVRRQQDITITGGLVNHYYVDISFAGGTTSVLLDTGSPDLVINSAAVPSTGVGTTGNNCSERYGRMTSSMSGKILSTNYGFAGYSTDSYFCSIPNLGQVGILGFDFPVTNGNGQGVSKQSGTNPLNQFHAAGLSSFAIYFANRPNGGGAFTPNDVDYAFIDEGANPVTESSNTLGGSGFWGLGLSGNFEYEGNSYPLRRLAAFVDTGTSFILVPPLVAQKIWKLTHADPDTGSYGSNCKPGGDPVTIVTAGGNRLDIQAVVYVTQLSDGTCINAFRPMSENQTKVNYPIVLGAAFIRAYYTYFDITNKALIPSILRICRVDVKTIPITRAGSRSLRMEEMTEKMTERPKSVKSVSGTSKQVVKSNNGLAETSMIYNDSNEATIELFEDEWSLISIGTQ